MPFGLCNASKEYQRQQEEALHGILGVAPTAGDTLVYGCGDTDEEAQKDHDRNLLQLLQRVRDINLKFNRRKLRLRLKEVAFIGRLFTSKWPAAVRGLTMNIFADCNDIFNHQCSGLIEKYCLF